MLYLPIIRKLLVSLSLLFSFAFIIVGQALAADASIVPATGTINSRNFTISAYVDSSTTEPEIASVELKINYPDSVNVVSIQNGDFDSYVTKNFDPATRTITISALNNAGNYKSGSVKVATLNFEAVSNTGDVALTFDRTGTRISGAGGQEMLTDVTGSNLVINIAGGTTATPTPTPSVTPTGGATAPETGVNSILSSVLISVLLLTSGLYLAKTGVRRK